MIQGVHDQSMALGAVCTKADDAEKVAKADAPDAKAVAKAAKAVDVLIDQLDVAFDGLQVALGLPDAPEPAEPAEKEPAAEPAAKTVTGEPATPAPASAAASVEVPSPTPAVVKIADFPEVQKLIDDLTADRDVQKATVTAQAATIADVTKRLEAIEKQPAPGGPDVRVVEKQIGGPAASGEPASGLTPDVLEDVIKAMPEGQAKDILLRELLKMNAAAGVGVTRLDQRIGRV